MPTFRDSLSVLSSKASQPKIKLMVLEDGTDWLSRNVRKQLPTYATQYSTRARTQLGVLVGKKSATKASQIENLS